MFVHEGCVLIHVLRDLLAKFWIYIKTVSRGGNTPPPPPWNFNFQMQSNLYKTDALAAKKTVCLIQVSILSRFLYFCMFSGQLKGPQCSRHYFMINGTSDCYPSIMETEQDLKNRRNSFQDINKQMVYVNYTENFVEKKSFIKTCFLPCSLTSYSFSVILAN